MPDEQEGRCRLPVLALTDSIADTLALHAEPQPQLPYRLAMRIADRIPTAALVAEVRRRGCRVIHVPPATPTEEDPP